MEIVGVSKFKTLFAVFFAAMLMAPTGAAKASTTAVMSQKILPVTFVYVGKNQAIIDMWSNVSSGDDLYVIKFLDASKKNEIPSSNGLIASYVSRKIEQKKYSNNEFVQFGQENGLITQTITVT